jgi:uncharacterized protein (DUF2267 family)
MMMKDQRIEAFETTLRASHEWVRDYGEKLGQTHPPLAFSCLRVALHVIRDRLPVPETAALGAQLPMLLRGAFYEGWRPGHRPPRVHTLHDLYREVSAELADGLGAPPHDVLVAAFALLEDRITSGEIAKLRHILPQPIREMWALVDRGTFEASEPSDEAHAMR